MSLTQWFTRSAPMVLCWLAMKATLSLVPTPSALDTSTGSLHADASSLNRPPNEPISDSTPGVNVDFANCLMRRTVS